MAQNRTVTDILQELKKDYKSVLLQAVKQATDTACEDTYKFSMSVLDRYYENYIPSSYDRTDSLQKATVPIAEVKDYGDIIVSTFGVRYDADILESFAASTYYDASSKYGNVDGGWVIENYLLGIHPRTDGSQTPGGGNYELEKWIDPISPDEYLKKYLPIRKVKLENDVNDYLIKYITR